MAKRPQYLKDGWRQNGPGNCICPFCHKTVSTNALARASHAEACYRRRHPKDGKPAAGSPGPSLLAEMLPKIGR